MLSRSFPELCTITTSDWILIMVLTSWRSQIPQNIKYCLLCLSFMCCAARFGLWPLSFPVRSCAMHCAAFPLPRSPCLRKWLTAGGRDGSPSHAVSADLPMGSVDFGERASAPEPGKCMWMRQKTKKRYLGFSCTLMKGTIPSGLACLLSFLALSPFALWLAHLVPFDFALLHEFMQEDRQRMPQNM